MWGSNSRPSDFWTRLWDWRAAYCANEAPAVLAFSCDIVAGCTSHVDWLSEKATYLAEFATTKCGVFCDTAACNAFLVTFCILLSLKCLPSLHWAWRLTDIPSYIQLVFVGIQSNKRNFRQLLWKLYYIILCYNLLSSEGFQSASKWKTRSSYLGEQNSTSFIEIRRTKLDKAVCIYVVFSHT